MDAEDGALGDLDAARESLEGRGRAGAGDGNGGERGWEAGIAGRRSETDRTDLRGAWTANAEIWGGGPGDEDDARPEGPELEPEPEPEPEEEEIYEYTEQQKCQGGATRIDASTGSGQVLEMRAAFSTFDLFRNDSIPIGRLGAVLRKLGLNPTEGQLRDAARWLDADPARGVVRFKEFLIIMGRALQDPVTEQRVLQGFLRMDENATGAVERARLADVLTTTGERLYPNEFAAFIKYADPKKRGVVKYEDFVKRMGSGHIRRKKKKRKRKKGKKKKKVRQREPGSVSMWSMSSAIDLSV